MQVEINHNNQLFTADSSQPINISITLQSGSSNPNCFYAPPPSFAPVKTNSFIGDTQQGGVVNFFDVQYNPHGNGTHTECVGHIAKERYYINDCLKQSLMVAQLITAQPEQQRNDFVITKEQLVTSKISTPCKALIIRTLPNDENKTLNNYSGSNPAYIQADAMQYIVDCGVEHLVIDLPSVDREEDGGLLAAHRIFWNYQSNELIIRKNATITELAYIPTIVPDGIYLLNIQIMPIQLDASSSTLLLYKLTEK